MPSKRSGTVRKMVSVPAGSAIIVVNHPVGKWMADDGTARSCKDVADKLSEFLSSSFKDGKRLAGVALPSEFDINTGRPLWDIRVLPVPQDTAKRRKR